MGQFDNIPTWGAGHIILDSETTVVLQLLAALAADGGLVDERMIVKASDTTYVTDATLNNDPDFVFPMVANAVYAFTGYFHYVTNGTALFDFAWTMPAGTAGAWVTNSLGPAVGANVGITDLTAHGTSTTVTAGSGGGGNAFSPVGRFTTGSTAGNAVFQHCQHVSNAVTTGLKAGSWCSFKRIG